MDEITKLDAILAIFTTPSEGEEMTISTNVKQETMAALRSSTSQTEAAGKLGISQSALCYRIKKDPDLMEIAASKGFIRKAESPVVKEAKRILGVAPTPGEDREIPAPAQGENRGKVAEEPVLAFKGAVVFLGESFWVDVKVERRVG